MKRSAAGWVTLIVLLLVACTTPEQPDPRELTQRQRDSIVARSPLPGTKGVGKALDVLGTSEARAAALDSIK